MARQAPIAISGSDTTIRGTMVHAINAVPLFPCAICAIVGAHLGLIYPQIQSLVWVGIMALGVLLTLFGALWRPARVRSSLADVGILLGVGLAAAGFAGHRASSQLQIFAEPNEQVCLSGVVDKIVRSDSSRISVYLQPDTLWLPQTAYADPTLPLPHPTLSETQMALQHKGMVTFRPKNVRGSEVNAQNLRPGTRVHLVAHTVEPFCDPFSDFDYQAYLQSQGLAFMANADSFAVVGHEVSLSSVVGQVNQWFVEMLKGAGLSRENIAFLQALVLADRSEMNSELRQQFSVCGTAHMLAVSGMHVALLAQLISILLVPIVGKRWTAAVAMAVVWTYALLVGMAPPVVRASIMFSFVQLSYFSGHKISGYHGLTFAACLIVFADPLAVHNAGFWLSFSAVAGLMAASAMDERLRGKWPENKSKGAKVRYYFLSSLWVSLVAQVVTSPIILYAFHSFPTYFWLNNLVMAPLITCVFGGALVCVLLGSVPLLGSVLGMGIGWIENVMLDWLTYYSSWASGLPLASFDCGGFGLWTVAGCGVAVGAMCFAMRQMRVTRAMLIVALVGLGIVGIDGLLALGNSGLAVYVARGETSVALFERGHIVHFQEACGKDATLRAEGYVTRRERCSASETLGLGRYLALLVGETRVCVVSDTLAATIEATRGAEVVVVNEDLMPSDFGVTGAIEEGVSPTPLYVVTPKCSVAGVWRVRCPKCVVLGMNDFWEME